MATPITLKVFRGNELVRTEQFNREIIKIGRLASAHLVLDDEKVSRIHSVIEVAPDGAISIIDMGSAEGTFVNGKKVSRGALRAGDQITLGGMRLVLEGAEAAPAAVAAPAPAAPVNRAVSVPTPAATRPSGPGKNGHTTRGVAASHEPARPAEVARASPSPRRQAEPASSGSGRADPS